MGVVRTYTCPDCGRLTCICGPSMPTPSFYSRAMDRPMNADEPEPFDSPDVQPSRIDGMLECEVARVNRKLEANGVMLDQMAHLKEMAERYKALWARERMRRGALREEVYTVFEMDHAKTEAQFLKTELDGHGNVLATRES